MLTNCQEPLDAALWHRTIDEIISSHDPVLCNLQITQAHYQLSQLLRRVTGADSGANFHTWAVWGSKKVGETIRQEDTRNLQHAIALVSAVLGGGLLALGTLKQHRADRIAWLISSGAVAFGPSMILRWRLSKTRREILEGNRTVLKDIGKVTADFVSAFHDCRKFDAEAIDCFLDGLRQGKTERGGQALLARAFLHYYHASFEPDLDRKHEQMFLANCYAILHEHIRLEPYIRAAIPSWFRRPITTTMLRFYLGGEPLDVHGDVPLEQSRIFPETLRELDNAELIAFLQGMEGWDRTPNTLAASGAGDWSNLKDRMNFIVDLFRSRHLSPMIFDRPFTEAQEDEIVAGRVPKVL